MSQTVKIFVALLFGLAIVGGFVYWLKIRSKHIPPQDARRIAQTFLEQLRNGGIDSAWAETTAEFKSFMGRDRLKAFVAANKVFAEPLSFQKSNKGASASLTTEEYYFVPSSNKPLVTVVLAPENSQWRVERVYVDETRP